MAWVLCFGKSKEIPVRLYLCFSIKPARHWLMVDNKFRNWSDILQDYTHMRKRNEYICIYKTINCWYLQLFGNYCTLTQINTFCTIWIKILVLDIVKALKIQVYVIPS